MSTDFFDDQKKCNIKCKFFKNYVVCFCHVSFSKSLSFVNRHNTESTKIDIILENDMSKNLSCKIFSTVTQSLDIVNIIFYPF